MTELLFRDDAYARSCTARVIAVDERGIRLDRTVFYPNGGGQPGDRSPAVIERFERWPAAEKVQRLVDDETGWLFAVKRTPTFALKGEAELLSADGQYIMLGNVVPKNGEVILSLHYQAGMRASPGRVQIERATSGDDDIGFVRLRLATTAKFVTLTWER